MFLGQFRLNMTVVFRADATASAPKLIPPEFKGSLSTARSTILVPFKARLYVGVCGGNKRERGHIEYSQSILTGERGLANICLMPSAGYL